MGDTDELKNQIRRVLIDELMLDLSAEEIESSAPLFDADGVGLDSVDALQLVVAIEKHFGLKIKDTEEARSILQSVNTLAAAIESHQQSN